ncbi:MAG: leucine-rich repeat domain-containing protein [Candidatus Azobacteroides sp.]|nr:leucine-rich repeat domain-containing protein [Candidatus Azobacteroides sp.]
MKKIGLLLGIIAISVNSFAISNEISSDSLDLSMQQPKLTAIPDYVFDMTNLQFLNVAFNHIGTVPERILELTNLETLNVSGNFQLTKLPDFLMEMKSLKVIYLEGMKTWSQAKKDEAVRRFAQRGITVILSRQYYSTGDSGTGDQYQYGDGDIIDQTDTINQR